MKRHEHTLPIQAKPGQLVAVDLEMWGQETKRLHRPHGTFAALVIVSEGHSYLITDETLVKPAMDRVLTGIPVFHNASYDITQLEGLGVVFDNCDYWDTEIVERLLWAGYYDSFSLADLARRYFDIILDKGVRETFYDRPDYHLTEEQKQYTYEDGETTYQIALHQQSLMTPELNKLYWEIEHPAAWAMHHFGPVHVNVPAWTEMVMGFEQEAARLQEKLGFNVGSPQQVKAHIKGRTGIDLPNTEEGTLMGLVDRDPIFKDIVRTRKYRKAVSTYGMSWLEANVEEDGLVYANFNSLRAVTGRASSSNPNLQNIPVRDDMAIGTDQYRKMFDSRYPKGVVLVSDVSQQEPRITAWYSQDKSLLDAFERGEDIHQFVTDQIAERLGKTIPRSHGKAINLGLVYGKTATGLSEELGVSRQDAQDLIDAYFDRFPGVRKLLERNKRRIVEHGYVTTAAGRRIWVSTHNYNWENFAINYPIQGGAADMTKLALSKLYSACWREEIEYPVTMQIHDEIVCDLPTMKEAKYVAALVDQCWLEAAAELYPGVPFVVETVLGTTWNCKAEVKQ